MKPAAAERQTLLSRITSLMASRTLRLVLFGFFTVQTVLLAFIMQIGTPPDETNHIQFIEYYANHSLSPILHNQVPTYYLGDKTREPDFMYHYLMSLLYRATPGSPQVKYVTIRLVSVALAITTLYVIIKIFRRVGLTDTIINLWLLIISNLPMVLMMSAAVNNDVTVWLGIALGTMLLMRLWERHSIVDLLWLAIILVWGGLFKRDLLPIDLLFALLGVVLVLRHVREYLKQLKLNWRIASLVLLLVLGLGLFAERIGGNLLHYGTITPSCEQVQGQAGCQVFWITVRAQSLALQPLQHIMPIPEFVVRWFAESVYNISNIQTQFWHHFVNPVRWLAPLLIVLLLVGLLYGVFYEQQRWRRNQHSRMRLALLLIAGYYIVVQMAVNFVTYRHYRLFELALNGRYIIPSILLLTGLVLFYWSQLLKRQPRLAFGLAIFLILLLVSNDGLQLMLRNPQLYNG